MIEFTMTTTVGFSSCNGCGKDMGTTGREMRVNACPENPNAYTALRFCPTCLDELAAKAAKARVLAGEWIGVRGLKARRAKG